MTLKVDLVFLKPTRVERKKSCEELETSRVRCSRWYYQVRHNGWARNLTAKPALLLSIFWCGLYRMFALTLKVAWELRMYLCFSHCLINNVQGPENIFYTTAHNLSCAIVEGCKHWLKKKKCPPAECNIWCMTGGTRGSIYMTTLFLIYSWNNHGWIYLPQSSFGYCLKI